MIEQLELFANGPFSIRLPFEEAMRIFWETYWSFLPSAATTRAHRIRLCCYFKGRHVDTIGKADIEALRRYLKALHLSEPTINKHHIIVTRMFSKLREYQETGNVLGQDFSKVILPLKNPGTLVPKVNERTFARKVVITPDEFRALRQYADEPLKHILNMLVWTRLRPSDLKRLNESNINWHTRQLEGIQSKTITTKNPSGVPYIVPFTPKIERLLRERIAKVRPGTPLFDWRNMQKRWEKARRLAGLLLVQMRDLRRSAATYLLDTSTDEVTVSEGLGHTTTRTTKVYVPRTRRHLAAATEKLVEAF